MVLFEAIFDVILVKSESLHFVYYVIILFEVFGVEGRVNFFTNVARIN